MMDDGMKDYGSVLMRAYDDISVSVVGGGGRV